MENHEKEVVTTEEKQKKKFPKFLIPIIAVLVLLLGTYGAGFAYSYSRFLPNTYLKDSHANTTIDISTMEPAQVETLLLKEAPEIQIQQKDCLTGEPIVETMDLKEVINASMSYDIDSLVKDQDHAKWFMGFFQDSTFEKPQATSEFDPNLLKLAINKLYCMQRGHNIEARNAYIKETFKDGEAYYTLVPAVDGAMIDRDGAIKEIEDAVTKVLAGEGNESVDLSELYTMPTVREDDPNLQKTFKDIKSIMSKTIKVYPTGWATEKLSGQSLRNLLTMDESGFSVNEEALQEYVDTISSWYSISRFNYIEKDTLYENIKNALLDTKDAEITADWVEIIPEPKGKSNSPSIIEVSIGDQYLWYYEYGKLILSTPVVTGNPNAGKKATYVGTNYVHTKARNIRLKSDDKDDPYDVKVAYWIGIDGTGYYGIHDASWRGSFGGSIYTYNPSHGCVNVPVDVAARLYDLVKIGETDVYIYW